MSVDCGINIGRGSPTRPEKERNEQMNEMTRQNGGAPMQAQAAPVQLGGGANVAVAASQAMAEVQSRVAMAKMFPRDVPAAIRRINNACSRPGLAENAMYVYGRGGQEITGPSIRLAEVLAQCYGNLEFGIRELEQRNGESTCEAHCWDMETNVRQSKIFQVPHVRHTKRGDCPLTDPRDIYELVANNGARRLRACILGIIPGDIVDEAVETCDKTLRERGDISPEHIEKLLKAFADKGVTRRQVEAWLQRSVESITPMQVIRLRKIYMSIKDGMSVPADWFGEAEPPAAGPEKKTLGEILKKMAGSAPEEAGGAEAEPDGAPPRR